MESMVSRVWQIVVVIFVSGVPINWLSGHALFSGFVVFWRFFGWRLWDMNFDRFERFYFPLLRRVCMRLERMDVWSGF